MNVTISSCLPEGAPFKSYDDVIRHLDGLGVFHMDMGLGRMERALSALGLDRLSRPTVQVVGTNGKGSTSSFLQSLAMAHGLKAGLYTSPHFVVPEERTVQFEISGRSLLRKIRQMVGWDDDCPRLCYGEYLPAHQAIRFNLMEAEPVRKV